MSEDLKESIDSCVNYAMGQDDETKRRIFTGLFEYVDRLVNEDILVKALNDEAKHEWFNNRYYQDRIDKAIEYINNWLEGINNEDIIIVMNNLGNILKGEDKNDPEGRR